MYIFYDPQKIDKKWQAKWESEDTFKVVRDYSKKKYYVVVMFPYPSGKIHMGHVRVYTIGDVIARYKRMSGYNVLHPIGWDAFGMPAENAAIENNTHPADWTYENIKQMRRQLKSLGFSYDWSRELTTCKPDYYRWEQWLFVKMVKKDMAYRKEAFVNWCSHCETVLANEQVEDGKCWRCAGTIIQKKLWQWFFRITDYADDLLIRSDSLAGWPEKVISMQKNWIGKSLGVEIKFAIDGIDRELSVFTTRPDTIFGTTFLSLASEHPLALELAKASGCYNEVFDFIEDMAMQERSFKGVNSYEKIGVFTGAYCINPVNSERIPVYVVNFALMGYGTGAVMSVPAHDQRDFEFAQKYNLPIKVVIKPKDSMIDFSNMTKAFLGEGFMANSGIFNGIRSKDVFEKIINYLEDKGYGCRTVSFKLRDWGVSRQRYWGTPIPIVYCDSCGAVPVKEEDLPIILPEEANLLKGGRSPLSVANNFMVTTCPKCGSKNARRETDTMDTFVESSWYFERFCSPHCETSVFNKESVSYWMPVDQYVGGIEHAILHLLYARYFTRVLNELGLVTHKEPFTRVLTQGMVCKETFTCLNDGFIFPNDTDQQDDRTICKECGGVVTVGRIEKMSKSKKNVINPETLINKYGADTVRLFCLFAAPPEKNLEWNEQGVEGSSRFLNRVCRITLNWIKFTKEISSRDLKIKLLSDVFLKLFKKTHETIKKVTQDVDRSHFNTAISSMMELVNVMYATECHHSSASERAVMKFSLESLVLLLSPMVPHFSEEMWEYMGNSDSLAKKAWPKYDNKVIIKDKIFLVVQINGKLKKRIETSVGKSEDELKTLALSDNSIAKFIKNKTVVKIISVKNKLVNIVLK